MFKIDTTPTSFDVDSWNAKLDQLTGPTQPKPKAPKASKTPEQREADRLAAKERREALQAKAIQDAAAAAKPTWRQRLGDFVTRRFRDLALACIVLAAFVGVYDGSFYSATAFSFMGWSAYAFAAMPDALMVLSAAKMREQGITPTQHDAARKAMRFGLLFSLATNMIAAALRQAPAVLQWTISVGTIDIRPVAFIGAVVYHGVVVLILKHAVEVITKVRADRKGHNGSESMNPIDMLANVAKAVPNLKGRKGSEVVAPAQKRGK